MASPFTLFRRHPKVILGTILLAMVSFVFFDPRFFFGGGGHAPTNPVVVESKYGALHAGDLKAMEANRELVSQFLDELVIAAVDERVRQGLTEERFKDQEVMLTLQMFKPQLMVRSRREPQPAAVETMVLARRAEELGLVASDAAINEFLVGITDNKLDSPKIIAIIGKLSFMGHRISQAQLFDALRQELLASRMRLLFDVSLRGLPPGQWLDYYERVNLKANCQVLGVEVADFIRDIPDPPAAELEKFFDEHKTRFASPSSPEPGFRQPNKAAFQYFKANFDDFVERAKPTVKEEEIAAYYEQNKDRDFKKGMGLPPELEKAKEKDADSDAGKDPKPATSGEDAPKNSEGAGENKNVPDKELNKPKEPAKEPTEPAKDGPANDAKKPGAASLPRRTPIVLVSDAAAEKDKAETAQPPKAAEAKAVDAKDDPPKPNFDDGKLEQAGVGKSTSAEKEGAAKEGGDSKADSAGPVAAAKKPEYEPLEKVHDQIRNILASEKASTEIDRIFSEISREIKRHSEEQKLYDATHESDPGMKPPLEIDVKSLAEKHHLLAAKTLNKSAKDARTAGLISPLEALQDTELGKSYRVIEDRRALGGFRAQPFYEFAFDMLISTYQPIPTRDTDQNQYLSWKTQQQEEHVPALADVRDEVVRAWKMIAARKRALAKAKQHAQEAEKAGKTLKELFREKPDLKVVDTGEFSWITLERSPSNPQQAQPRMSSVEGVEMPGESFMRTVFGLKKGQFGEALNEPQTIAYVIELLDFNESPEKLREMFADEDPTRRYQPVALPDRLQMYRDWIKNLMTQAKVEWVDKQAQIADEEE